MIEPESYPLGFYFHDVSWTDEYDGLVRFAELRGRYKCILIVAHWHNGWPGHSECRALSGLRSSADYRVRRRRYSCKRVHLFIYFTRRRRVLTTSTRPGPYEPDLLVGEANHEDISL
jgi:hypothetical protein